MKKYKIILLNSLVAVSVICFFVSCFSSSRNNLFAYADDSTLTELRGSEFFFQLYLSDEGRKGNGILSNDELEYGYFQLYSKDSSGVKHKEGTEYWIMNVKGEDGSDIKTFSLAYADVNGERIIVPVNKMTFHDDESITVNFGERFPFSSNYEFRISSVDDYPLPMYSPKPSIIFPFLKNYAGVYMPLLSGWGEVLFLAFAVILLLYVVKLKVWSLFLKILLFLVAVFVGGMYLSWLIFIPIVIPTLISFALMFVPAIAKNIKGIYACLATISFVFCLWNFFKLEGFWMGVWMTVYVYMSSMSMVIWICEIFNSVCPVCGNLILDTYTNEAYAEAENAMLAVWDENGDSNYDESEFIVTDSIKDNSKKICYWCINGNFNSDNKDDNNKYRDYDYLHIK